MADVEADARKTRDHIGGVGFHMNRAIGCHQTWCTRSERFYAAHPLRGCGNGIEPQMHGRRARMIGCACKGEQQPGLTCDCLHHTQRESKTFKHGTLLNVEFEIRHSIGGEARGG